MRRYSLLSDHQNLLKRKNIRDSTTASTSVKNSLSISYQKSKKLLPMVKSNNRYFSTSINSEGFLQNLQQLKKLKLSFQNLTKRRRQIQNPQYKINLQQDIETWEQSIDLIKQQIRELRKIRYRPMKRRIDKDLTESKYLFDETQQQIKKKNDKIEQLNQLQARINYIRLKNQQLDKLIIQMSISKQQQMNKQTQTNPQLIINSSKCQQIQPIDNMSNKYETRLKQSQYISQRITSADLSISITIDRIRQSESLLQKLVTEHYQHQQFKDQTQ